MKTSALPLVEIGEVKPEIKKPVVRRFCQDKCIVENKKLVGFAVSSLTP
ncbi:MAG TPA: hypothetical protein VMW91_08030 [Desulfosporosinus sp.]|nr:hypothetical protein [Desulfosporosinus sp.]HUU41020.1 hypothetical protein [Desulfatiglandales bacterium]